jgi:hypothetical protein
MPIVMPASMPTSRITTLVHIINDPIISFPQVSSGNCKLVENLTHHPRLCDLMSWKGLAYLFLGTEP